MDPTHLCKFCWRVNNLQWQLLYYIQSNLTKGEWRHNESTWNCLILEYTRVNNLQWQLLYYIQSNLTKGEWRHNESTWNCLILLYHNLPFLRYLVLALFMPGPTVHSLFKCTSRWQQKHREDVSEKAPLLREQENSEVKTII